MTAQILSVTLFVLLGLGAAFPQATAEWGLLNGNSAVAGGNAATAFGNRLDRSANKIAGQILKVRQPKAEVRTHRRVAQSLPPFSGSQRPNGPSMIKSIQGDARRHSGANPNSPLVNKRSSPN
jgi:hypothetical protein